MQVYVDAGVAQNLLHTSHVCPTHSEVQQTCSYLTEAPLPSIMAELLAIRDGLTSSEPRLRINPPSCLHLYTDSTQAVRELRRVAKSLDLTCDVNRIVNSFPCPVRVRWNRRSTPAHTDADAACIPRGSLGRYACSSCLRVTPSSFTRSLSGAPRVPFFLRVGRTFLAV